MSAMLRIPREGGRPLDAYVADAAGDGPHPGVVVIHEIYGLNENIREIADRFAGEGYTALAVDLFSTAPRPVCMARILFGILIRPLANGTVSQLQDTLSFLGRREAVDGSRLGVIGFCMGGSYALQVACVDGSLKAASVFYGFNPRPLEAVARACPIVGSYPEKDMTAGQGTRLDAELARRGVAHDIRVYPGVHHSFFNDRGSAYDEGAARDSWSRTLAFFSEHVRGDQQEAG